MRADGGRQAAVAPKGLYIYMHTYIHTYINLKIFQMYTCVCFHFFVSTSIFRSKTLALGSPDSGLSMSTARSASA